MQTIEKVRKQFILDPEKINIIKRLTHAATETEAINKVLDMVIANEKIEKALMSVKNKGKIKDIYGRLPVQNYK
jgi:guanylate kinase